MFAVDMAVNNAQRRHPVAEAKPVAEVKSAEKPQQTAEPSDADTYAVDMAVNNAPREVKVAQPEQVPQKVQVSQIAEPAYVAPRYQRIGDKDYVTPHELSEEESFLVDKLVNKNNFMMAQTREWDQTMLKNANFNDYIQDTPNNYPAPRTSIIDLPPNTWERYAFKDEKAARDAEIAKRAAEYAAEPPVAVMQMRSSNDDYKIANNIQSGDWINEAVGSNPFLYQLRNPWEKLHPRTYNETAWTADAPAGLILEPTPLPIAGTPAVANIGSQYLLAQYDPWTLENHHKSNNVTWIAGSPANLTLEATPLPITGTPATANTGSAYAQYDPWTL